MSQSVMNQFQPSITEWFEAIGEGADAQALRLEDNKKPERLEVLYQTIGLPYERPLPFSARTLKECEPVFQKIVAERGDELCAIRLVPNRADLPKLRDRGRSIRRCYEDWFLQQDIPWDEYTAYVCPHSETLEWSATFAVKEEGIFGEITEGLHSQLTHGDTTHPIYQFRFDFVDWSWSESYEPAIRQVQRMVSLLRVTDVVKRQNLCDTVQAMFSHEYLQGYFEATVWPGDRVYFIDYNRQLHARIPTPSAFSGNNSEEGFLRGVATSSGVVRGPVVIVREEDLSSVVLEPGSILVCDNTDIRYLPLMKKAAGFITNRGSLLSHASIVARELKKPCVVATKRATDMLKNGDIIEIDGEKGIVCLSVSSP